VTAGDAATDRPAEVATTGAAGPVVVAAMGNAYRRDDGAGEAVVARVARHLGAGPAPAAGVVTVGPFADPLDLLGPWDGARLAVVVDAVRTGAAPGTVVVLDLDAGARPPAGTRVATTHGLGIADALRLARVVERAPARVVVVGIEGADFSQGDGLSDPVAGAVEEAAGRVLELVGAPPCA